jgi:hypothetical protein
LRTTLKSCSCTTSRRGYAKIGASADSVSRSWNVTASLSRLRCARKPQRLSLSVTNGSSATVRSLFSQRRSAGQCCGHCGTFSLENQQVEVFGEQRDEIPFLLSGEGQRNASAAMRLADSAWLGYCGSLRTFRSVGTREGSKRLYKPPRAGVAAAQRIAFDEIDIPPTAQSTRHSTRAIFPAHRQDCVYFKQRFTGERSSQAGGGVGSTGQQAEGREYDGVLVSKRMLTTGTADY